MFPTILGNRSSLSKLCDDLVNYKITREDIIEEDEREVSTTETEYSPVCKKPRVTKLTKAKKGKKVAPRVDPKIEAAAKRAKEIFSKIQSRSPVPSSSDDDEDDELSSKTPSTQEKHAPQKLFCGSTSKEIETLKKQVELLQKQLDGQASMFLLIFYASI